MGDDSDTIKKTIDLPKSDQQFIEDEVHNFAGLVRRMIGLEKYYRTDQYDMDEVEKQLRKIAEIGTEVRADWREKQEELLDKYDAKIEAEERQGIAYVRENEEEQDGLGKYTVDWGGNDITHWKDNSERTEAAKELGRKLAQQWHDTVDKFSEMVNELTDFDGTGGDEFTMYFEGEEGTELEGLVVGTKYVVTDLGSIDVTMKDSGRNYRAKLLVNYRAVY